jgi:hypothetical protein
MKNVKILVVEDITLNQCWWNHIRWLWIWCEIAENGKIAVEKLKEKRVWCCIYGFANAVMNGFEATVAAQWNRQ